MIKFVICLVLDVYSINCKNTPYHRITLKDIFPGADYHEILKLNKKCLINLDNLSIYRTPPPALELI
jgi:calcium-dependent protein kinase